MLSNGANRLAIQVKYSVKNNFNEKYIIIKVAWYEEQKCIYSMKYKKKP